MEVFPIYKSASSAAPSLAGTSSREKLEWAIIDALSTIPSRSPSNSFSNGKNPRRLFPSLDNVGDDSSSNGKSIQTCTPESVGRSNAISEHELPFPMKQCLPVRTITPTCRTLSCPPEATATSKSNAIIGGESARFGAVRCAKSAPSIQLGPKAVPTAGISACKPFHFGDLSSGFRPGFSENRYVVTGGVPSSEKGKRNKKGSAHSWECQAERCVADISKSTKVLYRRHRLCDSCAKSDAIVVQGQEVRFCQQCSGLHPLSEFDGSKRSCRRMLEKHLRLVRRRRAARKAEIAAASEIAAMKRLEHDAPMSSPMEQ